VFKGWLVISVMDLDWIPVLALMLNAMRILLVMVFYIAVHLPSLTKHNPAFLITDREQA